MRQINSRSLAGGRRRANSNANLAKRGSQTLVFIEGWKEFNSSPVMH